MSNERIETEQELRRGGVEIVSRLRAAGHEAWFVGGCVRDELLGRKLKDIDLVTSARPEEIDALFEKSRFVGKKFGVCLVRRNGIDYEVATCRKDGPYLNHRHPDSVTYGTIEDDVARRDFTVNALYMNPLSGEIRDMVGGQEDLRARRIRCVGDARKRFDEDALRLLRAIRFAATIGFDIEEETWTALKELAPAIEYISPERHREELNKMLCGPDPARALRMMDESGVLHFLLPEIEAMHGVEQGKDYHPEGDVFVHTLLAVEKVEPKNVINVWAAMLHDVGKPTTFERREGKITFYDHPKVGAEMARQIMNRLRFSTNEIEAVVQIIERHMTFQNLQKMKRSTLRRFLGAPTIEHDLAVHRADCLASFGRLEYYDFAREKLQEFEATEEEVLPRPLITGHDLMELGVTQGPDIGRLLQELQEKQLEGEFGTREEALEWAREKMKS